AAPVSKRVAIIGFGEAAQAFVSDKGWSRPVSAYDKLTDQPETRPAKLADYAGAGVEAADTIAQAVHGADVVLSLVTADQALSVAMAAVGLCKGSIYCDMNSVAPTTKQAAAAAVEYCGARYVDVAI